MLNGREDVTFVFFSEVGEPLSKTLEVSIDSLQKMKEENKIFIEFFFSDQNSSAKCLCD